MSRFGRLELEFRVRIQRLLKLVATKTKPSDATLADFRAVRAKVNKAALNGRLSAYYLDSTWETQLPTFKTAAESNVYQRLPDGTAITDQTPGAAAGSFTAPLAGFVPGTAAFAGSSTAGEAHPTHARASSNAKTRGGLSQDTQVAVIGTCASP